MSPLDQLAERGTGFVLWRAENGHKIPINPHTGYRAAVDKPRTWALLDKVQRVLDPRHHTGFGPVLGDGLGGVDLDTCRDPATGAIADWARAVINDFRSYTEISPSGTGVKIYAFGAPAILPANKIPIGKANGHGKLPQIEAYVTGRWFAWTGQQLHGTPDEIVDATEAWERLAHRLAAHARAKPNGLGRAGGTGPIEHVAVPERFAALLESDPVFARRWRSDTSGLNDTTGSGLAMSLVALLKQRDYSLPEVVAILRGPNAPAGVDRHADDRALHRMWATTVAGGADLTHDGVALAFEQRHGADWRHVALWGRWLHWTGQRWQHDDRLEHLTVIRAMLRGIAGRLDDAKVARTLRKAETVMAVASLARSNVTAATSADAFDRDLWLLGTPGGTVDLRTGILRPADRSELITKQTTVAPPPPGAAAPTWQAFLDRIFVGNRELIAYLQRLLGYALTGSTREHVFAFCWGKGANGKSTLLTTVAGLFGDYAANAPMSAFLQTAGEQHPTDLAMLRGARLVTAQETPVGKSWDETKLKALTGGDPISARFMRQDFFTFMPQFTLLIAGNHKPGFRGVGEAIRRRVHLIPFNVVIPPDDRDPELGRKLQAEGPAILRWMIDGAVAWQRDGLRPPAIVTQATEDYLDAEDLLGQWVAERCVLRPDAKTKTSELHADFSAWCEAQRIPPWSTVAFGRALSDRGFEPRKVGSDCAKGFAGIGLKECPETGDRTDRTDAPLSDVGDRSHARAGAAYVR